MNAGEPVPIRLPKLAPRQLTLLLATVVCYLVGYPLALTVAPAIGWTLVTIGGLFLLGLGVVTIRRVHADGDRSADGLPERTSPGTSR